MIACPDYGPYAELVSLGGRLRMVSAGLLNVQDIFSTRTCVCFALFNTALAGGIQGEEQEVPGVGEGLREPPLSG